MVGRENWYHHYRTERQVGEGTVCKKRCFQGLRQLTVHKSGSSYLVGMGLGATGHTDKGSRESIRWVQSKIVEWFHNKVGG